MQSKGKSVSEGVITLRVGVTTLRRTACQLQVVIRQGGKGGKVGSAQLSNRRS